MKLAFSGEARYPKFDEGYGLYSKRVRRQTKIGFSSYSRIVKMYCASLAERLCRDGIVDLPCGLGSLYAAEIYRKPQYRGDKFIGYGKMDWKKGEYDGSHKAFGIVFLPDRNRNQNLRCYGFVANRKLYKRMKAIYDGYDRNWSPITFNDEMI